MPTIRTLTAEVVGDTLNLREQETDLPTTPLAEVPTDTALDSIIGVKEGVPKQATLANLKAAIDALETVQTSSFTGNGVTFQMAKKNGICTLSALSGSLSSDFAANTAFATIPSGWRPAIGLEVTETSSGSKRINVGIGGAIQFSNAQTAGTYVRFSVTYVLA